MPEDAPALPAAPVKRSLLWRVLGFCGVSPAPQRRLRVALSFRFWLFALLIASAGGGTGFLKYSESPSFCRSCHLMEPYYDAWARSKHNGVACVECHYPPGDKKTLLWKKFQASAQVVSFLTETYSSKPYGEVEDISCLRSGCHDNGQLKNDLVNSRGIHFSHEKHLGKLDHGPEKLRCVSCHTQVTVDRHIAVNWKVCHLCHFKGRVHDRAIEPVAGCLACHTLPTREIQVANVTYRHDEFLKDRKIACQSCHQDVVKGQALVAIDRCQACHNRKEDIDKFKDTAYVHEAHVAGYETSCFRCHSDVEHGVSHAGEKSLNPDCKACHTDTHDLMKQLYAGKGARGVADMPSPMYLVNVDCVGCHIQKLPPRNGASHEQVFGGSEQACMNCHGPEYAHVNADVRAILKETRDALGRKLASIRNGLPDGGVPEAAARALGDASFNLEFIGHAQGMHNIYYAAQVLKRSDQQLGVAAEALRIDVEDVSKLPILSGAYCATLCHDKVGVKVPAELVKFNGMEMPHQTHIENEMSCYDCHVIGGHKDVRPKPDRNCLECHEPPDLEKK